MKNNNDSVGTLIVKAKLFLKDGYTLYKRALPRHRIKGFDKAFVGEIIFDSNSFDSTMNGNIVTVEILSNNNLLNIIRDVKNWNIYSGQDVIGELKLLEVLSYDF